MTHTQTIYKRNNSGSYTAYRTTTQGTRYRADTVYTLVALVALVMTLTLTLGY